MRDFSASWLALREPADLAARAPSLLEQLERTFSGLSTCRMCDLGAGTGASVRAFAQRLPARQHWTLIDHDVPLLEEGREKLLALGKADDAASRAVNEKLKIVRHDCRLTLRFVAADLGPIQQLLQQHVDLITASALLDLTSTVWINAFAKAAAQRGACVLATLNFTGEIHFTPGHPDDSAMQAAFNVHQKGDKGFGPAAGAHAPIALTKTLTKFGYAVETAASPWRLGSDDRDLIHAFIDGMASAVAETKTLPSSRLHAWHRYRTELVKTLVVGHVDLFATPPGQG